MKGQGLSITTIVVAAIALLILVVLVAVFTGQFGKFATGVNTCEINDDYECGGSTAPAGGDTWIKAIGKSCPDVTEGANKVAGTCWVKVSAAPTTAQ